MAMWSPLTPVIAKMAYVEEIYYKNDTIEDNYVAEIRRLHLTWDVQVLLNYIVIKLITPSIQEMGDKLTFLDVLISWISALYKLSIYRKPIFIGQCLNCDSRHPCSKDLKQH